MYAFSKKKNYKNPFELQCCRTIIWTTFFFTRVVLEVLALDPILSSLFFLNLHVEQESIRKSSPLVYLSFDTLGINYRLIMRPSIYLI
jgi:hypothetical protein